MDSSEHEDAAAPAVSRERLDTAPAKKSGKRRMVVVAAFAVVALAAGGSLTAAFAAGTGDAKPSAKKTANTATAPIQKGPLAGTSSASGTLAYSNSREITSGNGGVVTALPPAGATITLGEPLFSVDNVPIFLMYGDLPAWRALEPEMTDGPDVKALEQSLKALGYFDREPDEEFTWATAAAVKRWQKATGQEQTGTVPLGRVVFSPSELRVAERAAAVGDPAAPGGPMLTVTDLSKSVSVDLKLSDQQLGVVGAAVTIDLPNGKSTTGTVASVGVPTEKDSPTGGKSVVIPVTISLDDAETAGALQRASVIVKFPTERREDVLSVPIGALLALDGNRFGVEIMRDDGRPEKVPVTTGLFAAGRVEISGDGLKAGQKVVVPSL